MSQDAAQRYRKQVVEHLDTLIQNKSWESSLALKVLQRRIIAYRDSLVDDIEVYEEKPDIVIEQSSVIADDEQAVYICLYKNFADDISKWQAELGRFGHNILGRPIYAEESHALTFIESKADKKPEGFVEVWMKKTDIIRLPPERMLYDRFNHALLSIKPGVLTKKNIKFFTHGLGVKYVFKENKLVEVKDASAE